MVIVLRELVKKYGKEDLTANTEENCMYNSINSGYGYKFDRNGKPMKLIKLSFVDTFRFIASSVEKLKGRKRNSITY